MIKLASRRAAVVLAGSALTLAVGLLPAQAATTAWRINAEVGGGGGYSVVFTGVAASSPSDAWAVGLIGKTSGNSTLQTYIRHWAGRSWHPIILPAVIARDWAKEEPSFSEIIGASSASNVWVFGGVGGGYLRRQHGGRWSLGRVPVAGKASSGAVDYVDAVKVFSSTDVWAFGEQDSASGSREVSVPYAAHYNGHKWSSVTLPGSGAITAVGASSKGMWAVEGIPSVFGVPISSGANPSVILHWTASTGWQVASKQPGLLKGDQLSNVVAEPNGDVWFGGSAKNKAKGTTPLAVEWNGSAWSARHLLMRASSAHWQVRAMTPDGSGGIWALTQDPSNAVTARIWHLQGASWSQVSPSFGKHRWTLFGLAQVPGTQSVWAVGAEPVGKSGANGLIAVDGPEPR